MEALPKFTVYRSDRKSLRITLRSNGTVAVYCPKKCTKNQIEDFVTKHYKNLCERHNAKSGILFSDPNGNFTLPYFGKRFPAIYSESKNFEFNGQSFIIPENTSTEKCRKMYRDFLRRKAKSFITAEVEILAKQNGFAYNSVRIKATRSRWGSCSGKNNLNFSLALIACEPDFIRFVILHELCHTIHHNHGDAFYRLLDKVCPENRKLKKYRAKEYSEILSSIFFSPVS